MGKPFLISGCPSCTAHTTTKSQADYLQLLKRNKQKRVIKDRKATSLQRHIVQLFQCRDRPMAMFRVSSKLLCMLNSLPKKSEKIFGGYPIRGFARCFQRKRKVLAQRHGNQRLMQITFHTFRHWKATMEYAKTKDILHVMKILGHKNIKNTLIYTQLVNFEADEYVCKAAHNIDEAAKLIEAGFDYVCEMDGVKLFRKRK